MNKNPIQLRIDTLAEHYNEFAEDPQGRLLRWLANPDTARMVDAFVSVQNEQGEYAPDLFIRFDEPFSDANQHGFTLRDSLINQYQQSQSDLAEEGIVTDWVPPPVLRDESDASALVRCCESMRDHHADQIEHLVGVLGPAHVEDAQAWASWLEKLVTAEIAEHVRFMAVDDDSVPVLAELAEAHPERVVTVAPELNMPAANVEILNQVPGSGPGVAFRRQFVGLSQAAEAQDLAGVQRCAEKALQIASQQKWPQMQSVVYLTLGGACLNAGRMADALAAYRNAHSVVADSDDPAAPKLQVQTRLAEASVHVGEGDYAEAAGIYEQVAPVATEIEDHFNAMESWRMAAWCRASLDEPDPAWQHGHKALDAAEELDEEIRQNCTLPYTAQGLLLLAENDPYHDERDTLCQRLEQLLGADWRSQLPEGSPAS